MTSYSARLALFTIVGAICGLAANLIPQDSNWTWGVGALLALAPVMVLLAGARAGWPELHSDWRRGTYAVLLVLTSMPAAATGFVAGAAIAAWDFHVGLNAAIFTGIALAAIATVVIVSLAVGVALRQWSPDTAIELGLAAAFTLVVVRFLDPWMLRAVYPVGMGLFSLVIGHHFLLRQPQMAAGRQHPGLQATSFRR